ncbi:MAG: hypothetical protein HY821_13095 [Acidobacteria bacterium]|nr:hypothetical protein [Acidobacteriota bacterium]
MTPRLAAIELPDFGAAADPPDWRVPLDEYQRRFALLRDRMRRSGLTHAAVYADREHFAALAWLTGFDPRFEEALLLIDLENPPLLLAGNECMGYLPAAPPVAAGLVRAERFQFFSLPDQPKDESRPLDRILSSEGVSAHSRVGIAGWKTYSSPEQIDAPSYLADAFRFAAGYENVTNFSAPFIEFRQAATAEEIAFFEWTNTLASGAMARILRAIQPGALDYDLLREAQYPGVPLGAHMTLKCGDNRVSLASARGQRVTLGGRFSCGIVYWGANCCRCGLVARGPADLPPEARGYIEHFAAPYFAAMAAWFEALRIGNTGAALHHAIHSRLPYDTFHVFLNAGHLIHLDEWVSSPAYEGSAVELQSGMVMQSDVIPSHPHFYSSRMEDGYLLASSGLQRDLQARFPQLHSRCLARRQFMRNTLGLPVHDDVLPLSNLCGVVPPFLLQPNLVFALS